MGVYRTGCRPAADLSGAADGCNPPTPASGQALELFFNDVFQDRIVKGELSNNLLVLG